jgi:hypothetical protein
MDRQRLSAVGVVVGTIVLNLVSNLLYDAVRPIFPALADAIRSQWFPPAVFVVGE